MELLDRHGDSPLISAINGGPYLARILLLSGANRAAARRYIQDEIAALPGQIAQLQEELQEMDEHNDDEGEDVHVRMRRLDIASQLLHAQSQPQALEKCQTLLSQNYDQLMAPLSRQEKLEYKKMFAGREKVKPSWHGSLMLYEHFDDATALKKYLKVNGQIYQGIANKRAGLQDLMPHIMSFLREKSDEKEQRLKGVCAKAYLQQDQELMGLLRKNGVELEIEDKIKAQFN